MRAYWGSKQVKQGRGRAAVKVDFHGRSFGSKLEAAVYGVLLLREKAGEISEIHCQSTVRMYSNAMGEHWGCRPDFRCTNPDGSIFYVEAKGFEQDRWKGTRFIWSLLGPAPMEVWKGSYKRPMLAETIPAGELIKKEE